ncbi:MAG: HlyD family efflux transporter periplasmic adaptor subunit [Planctomycetaceae bacterium]|nr:HlyD family efflux transporter periplasmic adaptor subunit [Planctomycetaceae bacterium]
MKFKSLADSIKLYRKPIMLVGVIVILLMLFSYQYYLSRQNIPFTGYVISDNIYMSSSVSGTVFSVEVKRGQRVEIGTPLFQMDLTSLTAQAEKIEAQIKEAESQKAVKQAELVSAEAEKKFAISDMNRFVSIKDAVSQQDIDAALERATKAGANIVSVQNQISAAASNIESCKAELRDIEHKIKELAPSSPVSGRIEELMYKPGEWAPANAAIISIVPDKEVKVRFYIPQNQLSKYSVGTKVAIACDGGPKDMTATVDFISTRPEYTPPVIYSLRTRDKLVFMAEAAPTQPQQLIPGQPMDVQLADR